MELLTLNTVSHGRAAEMHTLRLAGVFMCELKILFVFTVITVCDILTINVIHFHRQNVSLNVRLIITFVAV